eukprot:CAMPEP_0194215434 /NCGR_PEP_ID=MMETSP0156-20130528/17223_1 /TAXON_ID=33649 /ORGANISM="Thalassionema nitzschioides, Strain L26-B" /LENGTH=429 /DNA_ID=CAMNT_0038943943 /DNA_START=427 /DNA_END=1716 /DNA_ORIENTATION=-
MDDRAILIFGGDVWDKGGSDLYVINELLSLKEKYPHRVHFVMGNRDINKMRLWQELNALHHDGVWWKGEETPPTQKKARLSWILGRTMGSPNAFEYRRQELASLLDKDEITDDDITQSYLESCHPSSGAMGQYLSKACLALKLGNLLVIHGALPWASLNTPYLPQPWMSSTNPLSPSDWLESLNLFAKSQVEQWRLNAENHNGLWSHGVWATVGGFDYWPDEESPYQYSQLMQYGMGWLPGRTRIPTIVYSSWMLDGMPRRFFDSDQNWFSQRTQKFMQDANIQIILSGHQPQGDWPTPINIGAKDRWILACDTSYSGDVRWIGEDNRKASLAGGRDDKNEAVVETLLEQCVNTGYVNSVRTHGILSNGQRFTSTNMLESQHAGKLLASDKVSPDSRPWWVKAECQDSSELLLYTSGGGYEVVNAIANH